MKNCNASTHQPAHRKTCLTLIMCIDMHFHSIFFSPLLILPNTSWLILWCSYTEQLNKIKVHPWGSGLRDNSSKKKKKKSMAKMLLHWTTQQNKSASLRFGLTWQFLKKKKMHGKVCQARVVSCCPAILLFIFLFFFHIFKNMSKQKKREEKGPKAIFEKECPKLMYVVMLSRKLNRCCPRSIRLKGYSCKLMLLFCTFTIIHPACLLPPPANQVTPSIAQAPICDEARLFSASAASCNQMNKKKGTNVWIMNYKKHNTDTKTFFPLLLVSSKRVIFRQVTCLKIALDLLRET